MVRSPSKLADEAGFSMIEVIISSVLVLMISLATFTVIDVTGKESANAQARSVASTLLSSEQQRLRSLSATRSLGNYSTTSTVTAPTGTVTKTYTVASQVDQVRDASGPVSCTTDASAPDYLRSTTSVSWPGGSTPLTSSSLITPSPGSVGSDVGTLVVHVVNGASADVQGLPVTAGSRTVSTNALGCAVFAYLPAGQTTVTATQSGWVAPDGSSPASTTATVIAQGTVSADLRFDQGGGATITFTTADRSGTLSTPSTSTSARLSNNDTAFPAASYALTSTSPTRQVALTGLFPFSTSYSVYAGNCAANEPSQYSAPATSVTVTGGATAAAAVRMPGVAVKVLNSSNAVVSGATVILRQTGSGCNETYSGSTNASGIALIPAPYGPYTACAYNSSARTTSASTTASDGSLRNTDPLGDTTTDATSPTASTAANSRTVLKLATSSTAGTC